MFKRLIAFLLFLLVQIPAFAQPEGTIGWKESFAPLQAPFVIEQPYGAFPNAYVLTAGTGVTLDTSTPGQLIINLTGSGGGTVTSFSAGDLSPLFTTSVANPTTTPALSFSLTNAGPGTIFGNWANGSGAPSFNAVGLTGQVPTVQADSSILWTNVVNSGTAGQLAYYATTGYQVSGDANATISNGALTLGVNTSVAGSLKLFGGTSGSSTISVPSVAGTGTVFTLPSTNGTNTYALTTNGSGITSWNQIALTTAVTGVLPIANGGTNNGSLDVTQGNVPYGDGTKLVSLATGTAGQLLRGGGTAANPTWTTNVYPNTSTKGDIVHATANNVLGVLAIGSTNNLLSVAAGLPAWQSASTAFNNGSPMTTQGDVLYENATPAAARLGAGTAGQLLRTAGAAANPTWTTNVFPNTDTTGDLLYASGTNVIGGLGIGTSNQVLLVSAGLPAWGQVSLTAGVTGVLPISNGGTNNGSLAVTAGGVLYTDGTKIVNVGVGTAGQLLESEASSPPQWKTRSPSFGGDGSDGAVTWNGTSGAGPADWQDVNQPNCTTFTQTGSTTSTPASGSVILATSTATFSGTTNLASLGNGLTANTTQIGTTSAQASPIASNGGSPPRGASNGYGGGGGGFGGAGGTGGDGTSDTAHGGGLGGRPLPASGYTMDGIGGSGSSTSASLLTASGSKGGNIRVCAVGAISFGASSTLSATGATPATPASGGGGGGGAAGYDGIYSSTSITFSSGSSVTATGGQGGSASSSSLGVGGGGGGGWIIYMSPSNTVTTAPTCGGGAVGGTGHTTNSTAGSAGVVRGITGMPNLPLIAHLERSPAGMMIDLCQRFYSNPHNTFYSNPTFHEVVSVEAAWNCKEGKFEDLCMALRFGGKTTEQMTALSHTDCTHMGESKLAEYEITQTAVGDFAEAIGGGV